MKKIVSIFQKYNGYISIVMFALMAVYALGMATPAAPCKKYQDTYTFYSQIMPYNNAFLILSIVGLLLAAFYFILRNHVRIVYYISNYVWNGLNIVFSVVSSIILFIGVAFYQGKYKALDFVTINKYLDGVSKGTSLNANTPVFALGYILAVVILLTLIPHVMVLVDKVKLSIRYNANRKAGIPNAVSYNPNAKEAN